MKTPLDLMTLEPCIGCEVHLDYCNYEVFEATSSPEIIPVEEVTVISGSLKVSP